MKLSPKQQELIDQLVKEIETQFPDTKFVDVVPSPETESTLWLEFTRPKNEERILDIIEFAGQRTTDILLEHGYNMLVLPVVENGELVTESQ